MITGFNPSVSNNRNAGRNQKQNFGSFQVPKTPFEARDILEKAILGDLKPTSDNLVSLSEALEKGHKTTKVYLNQLRDLWSKDKQ